MTARIGMGPERFGGGAGLLPAPPPMTMPGRSGRVGRPEVHGDAVHAVAQPGRLRAVVEDVAEMPAATRAMDLGARHEERVVGRGLDRAVDWLVEARPTGAGVELGLGGEERLAAGRAGEGALALLVVERGRAAGRRR